MLFGSTVVDVGLVFGGSVPAVVGTDVHCIIGVRLDGTNMLSAVVLGSALPDVNHCVVGILRRHGLAFRLRPWSIVSQQFLQRKMQVGRLC